MSEIFPETTPATAGTVTGTPGQAAYEAFATVALGAMVKPEPFGSRPASERGAWSAAALAGHRAIAAAPQPAPASASQVRRHAEQRDAPELAAAMRETRLMRDRFARFADDLEAEADKDDNAREGQPDGVARLLLQRTRDLRRLIARDMRSAAGLEAK